MNKGIAKPRIALFATGIFGASTRKGEPVLVELFGRLSEHFEIILYLFGHTDRTYESYAIKTRQLGSLHFLPGRLKCLLLSLYFLFDHFRAPVDLLFAISIFPAGHWAVRLGKLVNRKVVVQVIALELVSIPDIKAGNLYYPWHRKISMRVYENADSIITITEYQKKVARQCLPGTREVVVLPLKIDTQKFRFYDKAISLPVEFIHIASYAPVKDQDTMFQAFAIVAEDIECHLTVVGDGYEVLSIQQLLTRLGIRDLVTFAGAVDHSLLPNYFSKAHILVNSARFDAGSFIIQEAMASGVAVCGTRVGILADIGERYAGIVSPQNPGQMAERMLQLVRDPIYYQRIVNEAYHWITKYDANWSAQKYQRYLEGQLDNSAEPQLSD
jgi:glycosyltransferase involved in cell wall biosynthesis